MRIPHELSDSGKRTRTTLYIRFPKTKKEWVRFTFLTAIILLLLDWIGYQLFGPLSPNGVKNLAISALERRDANELCRLADPKEISMLHLTPDKVTALLNNTLWSEQWAKMVKERRDHTTHDMAVFETEWRTPTKKPNWKDGIGIFIIESRQRGWYLVLSDTLCGICEWRYGLIPGSQKYVELAKKNGIPGLEDAYHGTYAFFQK